MVPTGPLGFGSFTRSIHGKALAPLPPGPLCDGHMEVNASAAWKAFTVGRADGWKLAALAKETFRSEVVEGEGGIGAMDPLSETEKPKATAAPFTGRLPTAPLAKWAPSKRPAPWGPAEETLPSDMAPLGQAKETSLAEAVAVEDEVGGTDSVSEAAKKHLDTSVVEEGWEEAPPVIDASKFVPQSPPSSPGQDEPWMLSSVTGKETSPTEGPGGGDMELDPLEIPAQQSALKQTSASDTASSGNNQPPNTAIRPEDILTICRAKPKPPAQPQGMTPPRPKHGGTQ